ncbi:MAG: hypothetical protein ACREAB_00520 [Blastocatellia bacterium]
MKNSLKNYCPSCQQADDHQYPPLADSLLHDALPRLCDECHRPIRFISVKQAAALAQKHPKTMREWIRKRRVKFLRLADRRYLICYTSLFRPPHSPDSLEDDLAA